MIRTAEEILEERFPNAPSQDWFNPIVSAINEARMEAIMECGVKVRLAYRVYNSDGAFTSEDMGQEVQIREPNEYIAVDKTFITDLIIQTK